MTTRSVVHGSFTIERTYPASPARVFAAFASLEAKSRWFGPPADGDCSDKEFDFRVGGREHFASKHETATYSFDAVYYDIVPDERIVTAYEMYADDARLSVSVATVEITPAGSGAHLVYTEQGAFLDGNDKPEYREHGTRELLDKLGDVLQAEVAAN
jgi:uncharacterized protein YndB with AHSA1/START domain